MELSAGPGRLSKSEVKRYLKSTIPKNPPDETIDDAVFLEIEHLLGSNPEFKPWAQSPRLYCLLRMIPKGLAEDGPVFQSFLDEGLYDICLPFRECYLPHPVRDDEDLLDAFHDIQGRVLSKPEAMNAMNFLSGG